MWRKIRPLSTSRPSAAAMSTSEGVSAEEKTPLRAKASQTAPATTKDSTAAPGRLIDRRGPRRPPPRPPPAPTAPAKPALEGARSAGDTTSGLPPGVSSRQHPPAPDREALQRPEDEPLPCR